MMFIGVVIRRRLLACPITTLVSKYFEIESEGIEADREIENKVFDLQKQFPGWTITVTTLSKFEYKAALRKIDSLP